MTARSALPVDINAGTSILPNGMQQFIRPNVVAGVPIYSSNPAAPGRRVVNFNAFTAPLAGALGNEPRNFVRAFNAVQTDLSIRREFALHDRLKLQFRAEAFNLLNRANFGSLFNN